MNNQVIKILKLILVLTVTISVTACADRRKGRAQPQPAAPGAAPAVPSEPTGTEGTETAEGPSRQEIESVIPPIAAVDTYGGQLLTGYLDGSIPGEDVIVQTFSDSDSVLSTLAEMSMAIQQLKREGKYSQSDKESVTMLEGAMTQFLNAKLVNSKRLENVVEYGTAVALGVLGGRYADEIINTVKTGAQRIGSSGVVTKSRSLLKTGTAKLKAGSDALFRRAAAKEAAATTSEVAENIVRQNMHRILGAELSQTALGIREVASQGVPRVNRLVFQRTGIPGMRINYRPNTKRITVKLTPEAGNVKYFYVYGKSVTAHAKDGKEFAIPAEGIAAVTAARLRGFGDSSVNFISSTGQKIKTGVTNSRAYKYVSENPKVQDALKRTAVGGSIGVLTYLALRPLDTRYLFIDGYVEDLTENGVALEDFLDVQRVEAQAAANILVPMVAPLPTPTPVPEKSLLEKAKSKVHEISEDIKKGFE